MEKSWIIVHLHIAIVIMLRKTLIAMWHRRCAKIILEEISFSISLLWKPWHFELYVWSSLWARFRVMDRNRILASDSSSESPRPPWWFFVAGNEPGFGHPLFFLCLASSDRPRFSRFQKKRKVTQKATALTKPGSDQTRPDHGSDHGSDHKKKEKKPFKEKRKQKKSNRL